MVLCELCSQRNLTVYLIYLQKQNLHVSFPSHKTLTDNHRKTQRQDDITYYYAAALLHMII